MALATGTRLGPYEILALHGVGGMGEVYRARDSRLDRVVAIKVLSGELASDPGFRARFEREARAVAALNHPNICAVHDVGEVDNAAAEPTPFLVMEYVEGETLAERLARGALPLEEALDRTIEIGSALEKAHRQGIVHRDIKPANIMLTKSGVAKLLDFGLAKQDVAALRGTGSSAPTALPGTGNRTPGAVPDMTGQGTILGTFQYMAPEQLEGQRADARTDIFALGAVLYELVTGKKAFEGKSQVSLIAAILEREPAPVSTYQPASPPALDAVIKRCLAKDPDERWQSAGDFAAALRFLRAGSGVLADASAAATSTVAARRPRAWIPLVAVLAPALVLGALLGHRMGRTPEPDLVRFDVSPPPKTTFGTFFGGLETSGVISPNGRMLAFAATDAGGTTLLWLRSLETPAARPLTGTQGAGLPFWSPDSRWIAFFAEGKLKKIAAAGGTPEVVANAPSGRGGSWGTGGTIAFAPSLFNGLWRVNANGGEPAVLTTSGVNEYDHRFPSFLPDGRRFLYLATGPAEAAGIYVGTLDSKDTQRLTTADSSAIYARSGHLLFVRQGTLFAQPFDAAALAFRGDPIRIAESMPPQTAPAFSVSDSGILTYRTGVGYGDQQFAWFDRSGRLLETIGAPGAYRGVDLSPDGKRIAVHRHDGDGGDVWIFEPRGTATRLTFNPTYDNSMPIWSPDGTRIVFGSHRGSQWGIYGKASNGSGAEDLLFESEAVKTPMAWTAQSNSIIFWTIKGDQWLLRLTDGAKPIPLLPSAGHPQISPDGKWLVYQSSDGGRNQVFVTPFPSGDGRWQVSTNGGIFARWRADGKEIFYLSAASLGDMMAVTVNDRGGTLDLGAPERLFASGYINVSHTGGNWHTYAVSPDGQRFLIPRPVSSLRGDAPQTPITVVLNWTQLLEQNRP